MKLQSDIASEFLDLAADSHTPVLLGKYLVGVNVDMFILDVEDKLKEVGRVSDKGFGNYCSLIGFENRVLAMGADSEAILIEIGPKPPRVLGRFQTQNVRNQMLAHPANGRQTLLVRGPDSLDAWDLSGE